MPDPAEPTFWQKTFLEFWAFITSARMQLIIGGFFLLYFRRELGIDSTMCDYIRQSVVAAVIGISVRDLSALFFKPETPRVQV